MQSPKNSNFKIYIFIAICMVVIIGMWLYTLKLNLSKPSKSTFDWSEIFGGWGDTVKDVPPMPTLNTTTLEVSDELINELADKLKEEKEEVDTSNWQVYTNEEYGFEFKYPNGIELGEDSLPEQDIFIVGFHKEDKDEFVNMKFEINADGKGPIFNDKLFVINKRDGQISVVETKESGVDEEYKNDGMEWLRAYLVEGDITYSWNFQSNKQKSQEEFFKQILSTFKFIE
ncbi:MAG: hypothetical protein ABIA91_02395 [Patescibacteria group bacterium]